MNRLLYLAALWLAFATTVRATTLVEDRLVGTWVIDVKSTEEYLRSNKVLSEAALERIRPLLAEMHLVYDATGVQKVAKDGSSEGWTEIRVIVRTEEKTIFTSIDATGAKVTTTLTWDDGAFWQETTHFPRYRERFIRAKMTEPKQPSAPTSGLTPGRGSFGTLAQNTMIKLYRKNPGGLEYWETWENEGEHTVHWGKVGDRGKSETVRGSLFRSTEEIAEKKKEGFQEIDDLEVLMIEYTIEGMGSPVDLDKRHRLQERMDEMLGWTGLGHCDGGSMGSGTMEVCCLVVDFDIAAKAMAADLAGTEFANFTRIYKEE